MPLATPLLANSFVGQPAPTSGTRVHAIWTGGHLVLALGVLPLALRRRDPGLVQALKERYEPVGLVALAAQLLTGIELTRSYFPGFHGLANFDNPIAVAALTKIGLGAPRHPQHRRHHQSHAPQNHRGQGGSLRL